MTGTRCSLTIRAAWLAAIAATARTYGVNPAILGAHRPARAGADPAYWEPRKVALYVTVLASECTYAALARQLGLHKDTVASQCEEVRKGCASSPLLERRTVVLEERVRLAMAPALVEMIDELDRAVSRLHELAGVPETPAEVDRRRSIKACISEIAAIGPGFPTKHCGENLGELITFPRAEAGE